MAEMIEMMDFTEETESTSEETSTAVENADCVEKESNEPEKAPDAEETELDDNQKVPEIDFDRFLPILDFSKVTDEQICDAACNKLLADSYFGINGPASFGRITRQRMIWNLPSRFVSSQRISTRRLSI